MLRSAKHHRVVIVIVIVIMITVIVIINIVISSTQQQKEQQQATIFQKSFSRSKQSLIFWLHPSIRLTRTVFLFYLFPFGPLRMQSPAHKISSAASLPHPHPFLHCSPTRQNAAAACMQHEAAVVLRRIMADGAAGGRAPPLPSGWSQLSAPQPPHVETVAGFMPRPLAGAAPAQGGNDPTFRSLRKCIKNEGEVALFKRSETFANLVGFILACNQAGATSHRSSRLTPTPPLLPPPPFLSHRALSTQLKV